MSQKELEDLVVGYGRGLISSARKEHPDAKFAEFPKFHYPVDTYIYPSLYHMLVNYREYTANGIATVLANVGALAKLESEAERFNGYAELCQLAEVLDKEITEKYFKDNPDKRREISCKKGCSWCCYQSVQLNGVEAKHFWPLLKRDGNFVEQRRVFLELSAEGKLHQRNYARRLGMKKARCPFLSDEETCSVYEKRPLVCRYYTVYDDPKECRPLTVPDTLTTGLPIFMAVLEAAMFENFGVAVLQVPDIINHTNEFE